MKTYSCHIRKTGGTSVGTALHIHGQTTSFAVLLEELLVYGKNHKLTIVIDEFQRLDGIGNGIISDIQKVWDRHHEAAHVHLIASGSIYRWSMTFL